MKKALEYIITQIVDEPEKVKILDGDYIRENFHKHLGFTKEDINENNRLIAELCKKEKENFDKFAYCDGFDFFVGIF